MEEYWPKIRTNKFDLQKQALYYSYKRNLFKARRLLKTSDYLKSD